MKKCHFLIHAGFEKAGAYETWARERGYQVNFTHCQKGETLPRPDDFDILIIMGGPQSPYEVDKYPYLNDEILLISDAIKADKILIGACLGAQLIAESLGAKTEKSPHKEVGFFPLTMTPEGKNDPIFRHFPETFIAGHWHNDMPGVPNDAVVLAVSEGCPRQIIRFKDKVYGFQCHLEFDPVTIKGLIRYCPDDLMPGPYIQTAEAIASHELSQVNAYLIQFLDALAEKSRVD